MQYEKDLQDYQKANTKAVVILTNFMTEYTLQKVMRFETFEIWLELLKLLQKTLTIKYSIISKHLSVIVLSVI